MIVELRRITPNFAEHNLPIEWTIDATSQLTAFVSCIRATRRELVTARDKDLARRVVRVFDELAWN